MVEWNGPICATVAMRLAWRVASWRKRLSWLATPQMAIGLILTAIAFGLLGQYSRRADPVYALPPAVQHRIQEPDGVWVKDTPKAAPQQMVIGISDPIALPLRLNHAHWLERWRIEQGGFRE